MCHGQVVTADARDVPRPSCTMHHWRVFPCVARLAHTPDLLFVCVLHVRLSSTDLKLFARGYYRKDQKRLLVAIDATSARGAFVPRVFAYYTWSVGDGPSVHGVATRENGFLRLPFITMVLAPLSGLRLPQRPRWLYDRRRFWCFLVLVGGMI